MLVVVLDGEGVDVVARWVFVSFVLGFGVLCAPAGAATTLGALGSESDNVLTSGTTYVQLTDEPGKASYAAPTAGVITGWRARLAAMVTSTFKLKVVRSVAGGQFQVVGESEGSFTGYLSAILDGSFPARVAVAAGDRVGLAVPTGSVATSYAVAPGGVIGSVAGDASGTSALSPLPSNRRLRLEATLESDADSDGYGDETQDGCPADPARQSPPCAAPPAPVTPATPPAPPADTTAPVLTRVVVRGGKVLFTASESGVVTVRVTRLLDGRRRGKSCLPPTRRLRNARRCTRRVRALTVTSAVSVGAGSVPVDLRLLRKGRYEIVASARDVAGNAGTVVVRSFTMTR